MTKFEEYKRVIESTYRDISILNDLIEHMAQSDEITNDEYTILYETALDRIREAITC